MTDKTQPDPFLEKRLARYDRWLASGQIAFSARVIPVQESLDAMPWVMPTDQVLRIIETAAVIALQDCVCRMHYKRCSGPTQVCLLLNQAGDKAVDQGIARRVNRDQAADALKMANEHGLVHLSLYTPDHAVSALCACCPCCCHELQIIKEFGRKDILMRSDYVAATDDDRCIHCANCVERCAFNARRIRSDAQRIFHPERCTGCGLCVTTCPSGAVSMESRQPRTG